MSLHHNTLSTQESPQQTKYDAGKLSSSPSKTPISSLQEWCQKLGKTPQYDLTAMEGRAHQPQFVYRCTVGDITRTGQGGSKKAAKHAAAESVLNMLKSGGTVQEEENEVVLPPTPEVSTMQEVEKQDDINSPNPVGTLQELVVARGWRLPVYGLYAESGPAHKKEFIMCCTVESFKEYGSGTAKKHAKRTAATKMYNKIINLPPNTEPLLDEQKSKTKMVSFDVLYNAAGNRIPPMSLEDLANNNPCQSLQKVAECTEFTFQYHHIADLTKNGDHQCLLLMKTQPALVVQGIGSTAADSQANAASNGIQMLNVFFRELQMQES